MVTGTLRWRPEGNSSNYDLPWLYMTDVAFINTCLLYSSVSLAWLLPLLSTLVKLLTLLLLAKVKFPYQAATQNISLFVGIKYIRHHFSSPWQMLFSEVPLMWKPASQLQCWARFTWAQRGLRLNAGSFMTLHSGGAASGEDIWCLK